MSSYGSLLPLAWPSLGMIAAAALLVVFLHERLFKNVNAPCVGPAARFSKWPAALLNLRFARESIQEGYSKYGTKFFQIPTIRRWEVYICDPDMLRQYRNVGDQHLSMIAAMSEEFQFKWTSPGGQYDAHRLGTPVMTKALRWQRLRTTTANDPFFGGFAATCAHALDQGIRTLGKPQQPAAGAVDGSGWVSVPCFTLALDVVSQLTSKSLFGQSDFWGEAAFLHLCRAYADSVPKYAMLLHFVPSLLRETVAELLPVRKLYWKITGIICQEIRQRVEAQKGSRTKAPPGDLLDFGIQWVQDAQHAGKYEDIHISNLMSFTIFAALHTTSQLITLSIYELAARPEYMQPLRDEVERCMAEHGAWTKASVDAMHILDSFMKETQRCNVLNASSLERIALKPFTFSNGLHIPKGVWIGTPHSPLFQDERLYADPGRFDGMRFARQRRSADAQVRRKCSLTATSEHSMHFGHGRHTCPGRWMAADEAKLVMARLISGYDIALFGPRPPNVRLLKFNVPNMTANIWLRERSAVQHD